MAELIHEYATRIQDEDGTTYIIRAYADERSDGTWIGWLEFHPIDAKKSTLRTDQETSQASRAAIDSWALGLEPAYFEGALARAQDRLP